MTWSKCEVRKLTNWDVVSVAGVYYHDKGVCNLVCLGVVSNVLDSCLVKLNVIPATRTRRYGRDDSMIQVLGAQKNSQYSN